MVEVTCVCGFRGKNSELDEGKCPRCGTDVNLPQEGSRRSRRSRRAEAPLAGGEGVA